MQRFDIEVRSVAQGFNYRAYVGAETGVDGNLNTASADRIVGGWAPTYEQAEQKAVDAHDE